MDITFATQDDLPILAELAAELWPHHTKEELLKEFQENFFKETFLLARLADFPVGFAEFSLRHDYVEGTTTSPVAYLEGIYVRADFRGKKVASQLLAVGKKWGQTKGCRELASDTSFDNLISQKFHNQLGFQEVGRIVCFTQKI